MITRLFLHIYDYFQGRRFQLWGVLLVCVVSLCALVSRLDYKEDISDFMPFDAEYRKAMQVYQEVAAGNRVVLLFSQNQDSIDQPQIVSAVERYGEILAEQDTAQWITDWQPQIDYTQVLDVFSFVYENLPYYLTEADYARADSLWAADSDFVRHRLEADYQLLGSSSGSFIQPMLQYDPLGLGSRMGQVLQQYQPELQFDQYDGYVFTPDGRRCLVNITSPFGSSETDGNGRLLALLESVREQVRSEAGNGNLEVSIVGSPVIAVSNAQQIRHDSIWAVSIAAILILALLLYAFRGFLPLLHIVLSTGFGFLFGLGCLSLFRDQVSVIVLGIASIILGIAVNYPLHYLCHLQHEPRTRVSLSQLVTPLFIGNVTTVGAFLTLVPLDAVAVCDLGLFSALMLVGTIIFVLVFLPHLPQSGHNEAVASFADDETPTVPVKGWVGRGLDCFMQSHTAFLFLFALTVILGYFSLNTQFDSDLNHINYMTSEQRTDLAYLSSLQGQSQSSTVFVSVSDSTADGALQSLEQFFLLANQSPLTTCIRNKRNPSDLLPSLAMQQQRKQMWDDFWRRHGYQNGFTTDFTQAAQESGFSASAFEPFSGLLTESLEPLQWADFEPVTSTILTGMTREGQLVAQLSVSPDSVTIIEQELKSCVSQLNNETEYHVFDLASLNRRVSDALSDNFNYIGYACSFIVFFFLWFSFRRIELALLAFLPMALGWVWILGIMELLGIQFNIVNVILASFIFGQGDDYTIFVTEGLIRDYKEHRSILVSYQRSILLSALIMLIGIGALIVAQHPAMQALAQVTIIGMTVVVAMAWIIPPMIFRWLVAHDVSLRRYLDNL